MGASVHLATSSLYDGHDQGDKEEGKKCNEVFGGGHGIHLGGQRMALDSRISREALFYPRPGWYHGMMESGAAATDGEKTGFFIRKKNQFWGYPGASCVYLL